MPTEEKFDVIVVGAGLAGLTAALVCARAGLEVVVFERGEYPGAKNVSGGVLFSTVLNELMPAFWENAPVERPVTKKEFAFLDRTRALSFEFATRAFAEPPFNNTFTVLRSKFDKWYGEQVEEAGAMIIAETVVDDVIKRGNQVVGVKARRDEGEMYADVVIIAEGANAFLPERMGLHAPFGPQDMVTCVKEVLSLPAETIEERFNLEPGEGCSVDYFGEGAAQGMLGGGFVYTNRDTLSVGLGISVSDLMKRKIAPHNALEFFKSHPNVKQLLKGAKAEEFSAHLIPEYGYKKFYPRCGDGWMIVGDSAGFVNTSLYHEGSSYATMSGKLAGETAVAAKARGDFSATTLSAYDRKLAESFVLQDLKRYRDVGGFMHQHPEFLGDYPEKLIAMAEEYFTVTGESKERILKRAVRGFRSNLPLLKMVFDTMAMMHKVLGMEAKWIFFPGREEK
jgi:electron transfer flavoprotein-quinone oxidoreductase